MELYDALCSELAREKYLVSYYDEFIKTAPKGYLVVRERETGSTFYWAYPNGKDGSYKQLNITDQDDLVAQLVKKMIGSKLLTISKKNIKYMEKLKNNFCDISAKEILKKCFQVCMNLNQMLEVNVLLINLIIILIGEKKQV